MNRITTLITESAVRNRQSCESCVGAEKKEFEKQCAAHCTEKNSNSNFYN